MTQEPRCRLSDLLVSACYHCKHNLTTLGGGPFDPDFEVEGQ